MGAAFHLAGSLSYVFESWLTIWHEECSLNITGAEPRQLRTAQLCFYGCFIFPTAAYYCGGCDALPRFPATISWTIRAGLPKHVHHVLWLSGWFHVIMALGLSGRHLGFAFSTQMMVTGIISIIFCPTGHNQVQDNIHHLTALMYMLDHLFLFYYWKIKPSYLWAFTSCLLIFTMTMTIKNRLKRHTGMQHPPGMSNGEIIASISKLELHERRLFFRS